VQDETLGLFKFRSNIVSSYCAFVTSKWFALFFHVVFFERYYDVDLLGAPAAQSWTNGHLSCRNLITGTSKVHTFCQDYILHTKKFIRVCHL
jgi:hypothetical protein